MSATAISFAVLTCDGCGATHGPILDHRNITEVRGHAFGEGWRFPSQVNVKGRAVAKSNHDVCPECVDTFVPKVTP